MTKDTTDAITLGLSIFGSLTGISALVLGILNYRRDRAAAKVVLKWDMAVTDNPIYDSKKLWGLVKVTNIGRRSLYLGVVALELPKGSPAYLICQMVQNVPNRIQLGGKLGEGDPPAAYVIDQDQLKEYAAHWKHIRATAEDSTGKVYRSKPAKDQPSWARS
jgi:hypothetical protein